MNKMGDDYRRLRGNYIPSTIIAHIPRIEYPYYFLQAYPHKISQSYKHILLQNLCLFHIHTCLGPGPACLYGGYAYTQCAYKESRLYPSNMVDREVDRT